MPPIGGSAGDLHYRSDAPGERVPCECELQETAISAAVEMFLLTALLRRR